MEDTIDALRRELDAGSADWVEAKQERAWGAEIERRRQDAMLVREAVGYSDVAAASVEAAVEPLEAVLPWMSDPELACFTGNSLQDLANFSLFPRDLFLIWHFPQWGCNILSKVCGVRRLVRRLCAMAREPVNKKTFSRSHSHYTQFSAFWPR